MARIYHLNCPNCGGLISSRGERVVECKYCRSRSLVLVPGWVPRFYLKPVLDFNQARRAMVNLFKREEVEEGLLKRARFESADFFFVPFYLLRAKRIGVFTSLGGSPSPRLASLMNYDNANLSYRQLVQKQRMLEQTRTDSRVVFNELERSFPAVDFKEWGLEFLEPAKEIVSQGLELLQYQREELEKIGPVLEPRVSLEERLGQIFNIPELGLAQDQTQVVEQRVSLVYWPLWRVRWRYQGRGYQSIIDAVRGEFLFARAPAKERARVLWLLAVSSAVGLSIGKLLKIPVALLIATSVVSFWLILIFSTVLLFFVAFGWNMFRYSTELIIQGKSTELEFIGRPSETIFDKMAIKLSKVLEQGLKQSRRGRELSPWI